MIELTRFLHSPALVQQASLRPEVVTHRHRPGFIECQDGRWLHLPVQRRTNKPKARRRLWHWLAGMLK